MKFLFVVLAMASMMIAGCGKTQTAKEAAAVNTETFTMKETDTLMAQPADTTSKSGMVSEANVVSGVVVNNEEGPLVVENVASMADVVVVGDTPDDRAIQTALKNLGLYSGDIDGVIGHKTKEAIKAFQGQNGLEADGKVGPKTWAVLKKALETPSQG